MSVTELPAGTPRNRASALAPLRSRLARGAMSAFLLQVCSQGLTFALTVVLARVLGRSGLGVYSNANAWVQLLVIPGTLGMNQLMVREVAKYSKAEQWGLTRGFFRWASLSSLLACAALALVGGIAAWFLWAHKEPAMFDAVLFSLVITLPLTALTNLRQTAMRGLGRIATGLYPDMVVRPLFLIGTVAAVALAYPRGLTAFGAVVLSAVATLLAFAVGSITLFRALPGDTKRERTTRADRKVWLASAFPMLFLGGLQILTARTAMIALGAVRASGEVALFAVAGRGAAFIPFPRMAINTALAPMVARLYAANDMDGLQRLITRSSRFALAGSVVIALIICLGARPFLLLFGRDFSHGVGLVWVLGLAEVVSGATGAVGLVLMMTGHERVALRGLLISTVLTIVLSALLIPRWGAMGAAIADGGALAAANLILGWLLYRTTGLFSTALPVSWASRLVRTR